MDSDASVAPLLNIACRFLPHDQWFTTHVDPEWKVRQAKSWMLAKCLPYAAPPSPPLRQTNRKPQRPPSPITFAPDPRHRPISPITFAQPKQQLTEDDVSEFEEPPPAESPVSEKEEEDLILPPVQPKKRAIMPNASTSSKGDLYAQYTLIRFSTGQILEDDLPLSFYDLQPDELLELHRLGVVIPLPRSDLKRYLDAYWEGWVRLLRVRPVEEDEEHYNLYRVRYLESRPLEWKDRWVVVREGHLHIYRDQNHHSIHKLALNDLHALYNSRHLPPSAPKSSNNDRVLLARFSTQPTSNITTRASSPLSPIPSDSSSPLSSPVFAHDSDDSTRPRRQRPPQPRKRRKRDPEFLAFDLKDDMNYVSLLRVLHRQSMPASTFVQSLPVGTNEQPDSPSSQNLSSEDRSGDDAPILRHPPSLAILHVSRSFTSSLGALPFPEWRNALLRKAQRAGLGRIGSAIEWLIANEDILLNDGDSASFWYHHDSPVRTRKRKGKGKSTAKDKGKAREEIVQIRRQPTSQDGYDSDVSGDADASYSFSDSSDDNSSNSGHKSEMEWVGWMGDLRRQRRVAKQQEERTRQQEEARRAQEEAHEAELGIPQGPSGAEITIARVGTGVDDRTRRAAMEPSAVVTSLSGVNPPMHNPNAHLSQGYTPNANGNTAPGSRMTPVLSSPSSNESFGVFAFSPLAAAEVETEDGAHPSPPNTLRHNRTHSHTLLHSVSLHDAALHDTNNSVGPEPFSTFLRRPSMPIIGSSGNVAQWGSGGSRPSSLERGENGSATGSSTRANTVSASGSSATVIIDTGTGIIEVPRPPLLRAASTSGSKNLLRKKDSNSTNNDKERRPKLSLSTESKNANNTTTIVNNTGATSPPGTPQNQAHPEPTPKEKKKRRGLAKGVSMRAEKLVRSLDSALDFVDGR
ncbi:hypothetical protein MIND_00373000 [Mycena indigotica]|uniref:Uncharacterized protein n=1 Tax=Mycena indigotica TaxID=2126181 RepID=A0A8H6T4Y8_9AGAR|nr:uncharacterized protein MIND_00373000 [Mycena indigotica]KAF7310002.1 hypothetical protein MIND_00373000 [Mycena indigotica]